MWRVDRPRSFARRFSEYLGIILIGPALMSVAIGFTASLRSDAMMSRVEHLGPLGHWLAASSRLAPYLLVIATFSFLYVFVPNTRVRIKPAVLAGVLAGAGWVAMGGVFTSFVVNVTRNEAIYSGFAIVLAAMIWLQLSWLILLLGAQLAFYLQNPDYLRPGQRRQPDAEDAPIDPASVRPSTSTEPQRTRPRVSTSEPIARMFWKSSGRRARDRDLVDRMHDLAALDPEPRGAARVVAGHDVHALPEQLADDEALLAALDQLCERAGRRPHEQVVHAARVAGRRHAEPARRVARQHVALQHARRHELAALRHDTFAVERRARRARAGSAGPR